MREGGHGRVLAAASKYRVPVMIYPGGEHQTLTDYVRKFDSVQFIIDHVGMGVDRAALPNQLQTTIDQLLTYARYLNVAIKGDMRRGCRESPFPIATC